MRNLIVILLIIGGLYTGYHFLSGKGGTGGMGMMGGPMPVDVAKVIERDMSQWDEFSGRLEAVDRVEIRPRVAGTIDAIHFREGQMVKKGDLLFTIDPRPYRAALESAQAAATFTAEEYARAKTLLPQNAISKRDYDDRRSAVANAAANLKRAQLDLEYTEIRAPIAGRINRAEITQGNLVAAGGTAPLLTTIVSSDPIYASFDVDEKNYVRYMHAADKNNTNITDIPVKLALSGDNDYGYEGHIKTFDNELDTRSGTVRARAVFKNEDGALLPGLYARVKVSGTGRHALLLINEQAVATDQNQKLVFIVNDQKKVEPRPVKLGPAIDGLRVVNEGLKAGETIIVTGIQRARPGAEVIPQMVNMEKPEDTQPEQKKQ